MKKFLLLPLLLFVLSAQSQTVFGYWYGIGNVKTNNSANNYLIEMILQPNGNKVKGVINYYFKNAYRSLQISGNYNAGTRQLFIPEVPITYFGSHVNMEIDCIMDLNATLRVSRVGNTLQGKFSSQPEYKYTCLDVNFTLQHDSESNQDSVLKAIREYKETYQVWRPSVADTLTRVTVQQRKVVNYVVEREFSEREKEIVQELEIESDSITVDFYDNGEVDGDSISVFYNNQLLAFSQRLSTKSIHFKLAIDSTLEINELSMFADNLGSIPPNTALMIVRDGRKEYDVRLTSTLQKNATIRLKRKR